MIRRLILILIILTCGQICGQEWSLKLKSTVQLRTWTLTSRADKDERSCEGANIQLIQNNKVIKELMSDKDGNFVIDIPGNGDFYINVSYPGCNGKKFYVSTKNVASDVAGNNFKPSVTIGGFMMAKPFTGIDYIGLQEPLLAVEYKNSEFDKDQAVSDKGVQIVQNIMDAEMRLIDKFCFNTKLGDEALTKKNYKLAKTYYTKALELIPNEEYPKFKLEKAEEKIKEEEDKKAALAAEAAAKAEAQKLALQKAMEEKKLKENAAFAQGKPAETPTTTTVKDSVVTAEASAKVEAEIKAKAEAERLAAEKAAKEKVEADAKAKSDAEAAKLAAEKAAKEKAEAETKAKAEAEAAKILAEKAAKANADAKNKTEAEAAKLKAEKAAADAKADAEAAAKAKADTEAKAVVANKTKTETNTTNASSTTPTTNAVVNTTSNSQVANSASGNTAITEELPVAENVKGKAKRKIKPQIGGEFDAYKEEADEYFKEKKYKEAKDSYKMALKYSPNDHYAINRVKQCNAHLKK